MTITLSRLKFCYARTKLATLQTTTLRKNSVNTREHDAWSPAVAVVAVWPRRRTASCRTPAARWNSNNAALHRIAHSLVTTKCLWHSEDSSSLASCAGQLLVAAQNWRMWLKQTAGLLRMPRARLCNKIKSIVCTCSSYDPLYILPIYDHKTKHSDANVDCSLKGVSIYIASTAVGQGGMHGHPVLRCRGAAGWVFRCSVECSATSCAQPAMRRIAMCNRRGGYGIFLHPCHIPIKPCRAYGACIISAPSAPMRRRLRNAAGMLGVSGNHWL